MFILLRGGNEADLRVAPSGTDRTVELAIRSETTAYVSHPADDTDPPWPAVLVLHEAFGLNDDIRRIADRFAANGYLVVVPDLLLRGRLCLVRAFRDLSRGGGPTVERARATLQ